MYNLCILICICICISNRIRVYFIFCMDMKCFKENLKWYGCNLFYEVGLCNLKFIEIWILCFVVFKYWGLEDVDINEEFLGIVNWVVLGEEGINGNLFY